MPRCSSRRRRSRGGAPIRARYPERVMIGGRSRTSTGPRRPCRRRRRAAARRRRVGRDESGTPQRGREDRERCGPSSSSGRLRCSRTPRSTCATASRPKRSTTSMSSPSSTPQPSTNGSTSSASRRAAYSPPSGCTMSASFGNSSDSSGRATSSVTRPPPVGAPSNERRVVRLHEQRVGVGEQRSQEPVDDSRPRKLRRSASSQQMMSPRHACSDFHSALPLPEPGPGFGEHVAPRRRPGAPAARATAAVSSVEPSSMHDDLVDESVGQLDEPGPRARSAPMVAASSRAGRQTETVTERASPRRDRRAHDVSLWGTHRERR